MVNYKELLDGKFDDYKREIWMNSLDSKSDVVEGNWWIIKNFSKFIVNMKLRYGGKMVIKWYFLYYYLLMEYSIKFGGFFFCGFYILWVY